MSRIKVMTKEIDSKIKEEIKKLLDGKVKSVDISGLCASDAIDYMSDAGADVSDELDTNGWEYDYWIKATYNGKKYCIDGGGYYGNVSISEYDDEE